MKQELHIDDLHLWMGEKTGYPEEQSGYTKHI